MEICKTLVQPSVEDREAIRQGRLEAGLDCSELQPSSTFPAGIEGWMCISALWAHWEPVGLPTWLGAEEEVVVWRPH